MLLVGTSHPLRTLLPPKPSVTFLGLPGTHRCRERGGNREGGYQTTRREPEQQMLERWMQTGVTRGDTGPRKAP